MTNEDDAYVGGRAPKLRRFKRPRNRRKLDVKLLLPYLLDGLAAALLLASLAVFTLDPRWRPLGGVILFVGLMATTLRLHRRILDRTAWWLAECPHCQTDDLRRLRRRSWHRLLGWAGIPVRPYICSGCGWRGSRIDQTKIL
jgi:hypothetical protein